MKFFTLNNSAPRMLLDYVFFVNFCFFFFSTQTPSKNRYDSPHLKVSISQAFFHLRSLQMLLKEERSIQCNTGGAQGANCTQPPFNTFGDKQGFEETWKCPEILKRRECSLWLKAVRQNIVVLIYIFASYPHLSLCVRTLSILLTAILLHLWTWGTNTLFRTCYITIFPTTITLF